MIEHQFRGSANLQYFRWAFYVAQLDDHISVRPIRSCIGPNPLLFGRLPPAF